MKNLHWTPVLLLILAACDPGKPHLCFEEDRPPLVASDQPPTGGIRDATLDVTSDIYKAVVCIGSTPSGENDGTPCASGTLIAPNLVVSAQHLGMATPERPMAIVFGAEARTAPTRRTQADACYEFRNTGVATCCTHYSPASPSYAQYLDTCPDPLGPDEYVVSDLSVYHLIEPVTDVRPIPVALLTPSGSHSNKDLQDLATVAVGYGSSEGDCYQAQDRSGTRRYGAIRIEEHYNSLGLRNGAGESILVHGHYFVGGYLYDNAAMGLPGDSGGPLLADFGTPEDLLPTGCAKLSNARVVATVYRGCNFMFSSTVGPEISSGLKQILQDTGNSNWIIE